ncbi:MAG: thrombospondin type 3 repeat-containing protein [Kiritimatiellia bacterium]
MKRFIVLAAAVAWSGVAHALDANGNQQSDIWEMVYGVSGLSASGDQDNDRVSNSAESLAGTNPLDPASRPHLGLGFTNGVARIEWPSVAGKRYTIQEQGQPAPAGWGTFGAMTGSGATDWVEVLPTSLVRILRLNITDLDSDLDGLSGKEELDRLQPGFVEHRAPITASLAQVQARWPPRASSPSPCWTGICARTGRTARSSPCAARPASSRCA